MTSGPTAGGDDDVDEGLQLRARPAGDEDDLDAVPAGAGQCAADELRHPACGDADEHVLARRMQAGDGSRTVLEVVLHPGLRPEEGGPAAGHDRLDEVRRSAERRSHLGRFEDAEPAARPRADEDQAPSFLQRARDEVRGGRDAGLLPRHRRQDLAVLAQHQADHVFRGRLIHCQAGGVDGFGRKVLPLRGHAEIHLRSSPARAAPGADRPLCRLTAPRRTEYKDRLSSDQRAVMWNVNAMPAGRPSTMPTRIAPLGAAPGSG